MHLVAANAFVSVEQNLQTEAVMFYYGFSMTVFPKFYF